MTTQPSSFDLHPSRRGRGATPQTIDEVTAPEKNLFGRQRLKIRYRRLSTWSDEHIAIATRILVHYFMKLGAFQTINDAAMRIVINRLVDGMAEQHAIWSINAKLASLGETHADKLKTLSSIPGIVPSPHRFFEGHMFESWLDRSAEMRAQIAESNRAAAQRKAADPAVQAQRQVKADTERVRAERDDEIRRKQAAERQRHEECVRRFKALPVEAQEHYREQARAQLSAAGKLTGNVAYDAAQVTSLARRLMEGGAS